MKLIPDWREAWRFASVRMFALLILLPDAYNGIAAMGWLDAESSPQPLVWAIRGLAALGILARVWQQSGVEQPPPPTA